MSVAVDATSFGSGVGATITIAHTVAGANRVIYVRCSEMFNTTAITGVAYAGVSLTKIASEASASNNKQSSLWRGIAPAAGTANIVVSQSGSHVIYVTGISLTGADQTTPDDTPVTDHNSGTAPSMTVTSRVGDMVIDHLTIYEPSGGITGSATAGQTVDRNDELVGGGQGIRQIASHQAGGSSVTTSYSISTTTSWGLIAVNVRAVATGGGTNTGRPSVDIAPGTWTPSAGSTLASMLSEVTPDDSTYIQSSPSPTYIDVDEEKLAGLATAGSTTGQQLTYRFKKNSSGGDAIDLVVRLMQGTTEIASWLHANIDAVTTAVQTLTATQAGAITDYTDLRVRYEASISLSAYSDGFTGADLAPLPSPWASPILAGRGALARVGNAATIGPTASISQWMSYLSDAAYTDVEVRATVATLGTSGQSMFLVGRITNPNTTSLHCYEGGYNFGTNVWSIVRFVNGTPTAVGGTATVALAAGDEVRMWIRGRTTPTITLWRRAAAETKWTQILSYTDTAPTAPLQGSGFVGLDLTATVNTMRLDNLVVTGIKDTAVVQPPGGGGGGGAIVTPLYWGAFISAAAGIGAEIRDTSWNWFAPHVTMNPVGLGPNGKNYVRLIGDDSMTFPNQGALSRIHGIGLKVGKPPWLKNGNEAWLVRSVRVPSGFSSVINSTTDELHGDNGTGSAPLNLSFQRGDYWRIYVRGSDQAVKVVPFPFAQYLFGANDGHVANGGQFYRQYQDWVGGNKPIVLDEWVHFRLGFFFSTNNTGWFEAWARWGSMTTWLNIVPRKTGIQTSDLDFDGDGFGIADPFMSLYYDTGGGGQNAVDYAAGALWPVYSEIAAWQDNFLGF